MSDTTNPLQLTQAVLQRRIGADSSVHEPNVLLVEGIADRVWVSELGREGLARVNDALQSVTTSWRSSEPAKKAERLERELAAAESAENEARQQASTLNEELTIRLDAGKNTAAVENRLAMAKSNLARIAVRASVLRHLLDKARSEARNLLRRELEAARLKVNEQARQEHRIALRTLEKVVAEHFPVVNRSGYVFALTKTADVVEHHLQLAMPDQTGLSIECKAG